MSSEIPINDPTPQASEFDTDHLKTDLKGRSVRGGAVTLFSQGSSFIIQTLSTVIMARLLTPADFGLIAMVTAVTGFARLFKDLGLSTATVQKEKINHEQISTLFWINAGIGLAITILTVAAAPIIAWFYGESRLIAVTVALAAVFFFGGLTVQHQALLQRQMRFNALALIQILAMAFGVAAAIFSATLGANYWALVIMQIVSSVTIAAGVWILCDWRPGFPTRSSGVRGMLAFGGNITGFNIVNYFARNTDNILIGRVWGSSSLGFYSKAYSLLLLPLNQINIPISAIAIPTLSRLQHEAKRYRRYYLQVISLITLATTPLISFFIVYSDEIVALVLGPQWTESGRIFFILGFSALLQPIGHTQGWLHLSMGRSDRYLRWGVISSAIIVIGILAGLPHGPLGVAMGYTIASLVTIFPCMWYAGKSAGIQLIEIINSTGKNILAGLGSIAVLLLLIKKLVYLEILWVDLAAGVCLVSLFYAIFLFILYRNLSPWHQVKDIIQTLLTPVFQKNRPGKNG